MSKLTKSHVTAFFSENQAAEDAVAELSTSGFAHDSIHLLVSDGKNRVTRQNGPSDQLEPDAGQQPMTRASNTPGSVGTTSEMFGSQNDPMPATARSVGEPNQSLSSFGFGEEKTEELEKGLANGKILVAVEAGANATSAKSILERNGGQVA